MVSITPFGSTGPKAGWAASDITVNAASGQMVLTGDPDRAPLRISVSPQTYLQAAGDAAGAALVALAERNRSGLGQHVDISQLETGGYLIGLWWILETRGGPPFSVTKNDIFDLFGKYFEIELAFEPSDSVPERKGRELFTRSRDTLDFGFGKSQRVKSIALLICDQHSNEPIAAL